MPGLGLFLCSQVQPRLLGDGKGPSSLSALNHCGSLSACGSCSPVVFGASWVCSELVAVETQLQIPQVPLKPGAALTWCVPGQSHTLRHLPCVCHLPCAGQSSPGTILCTESLTQRGGCCFGQCFRTQIFSILGKKNLLICCFSIFFKVHLSLFLCWLNVFKCPSFSFSFILATSAPCCPHSFLPDPCRGDPLCCCCCQQGSPWP